MAQPSRTIELSGAGGRYGYKKPRLRFSSTEIKHLLIAWLIVSLAFAIAFNGFSFKPAFLTAIIVSAITVGVGFIFHEMAHKFTAQHYRCVAEFRADFQMLVLALIISILGVVFAAPGAVMIFGNINKKQNGIISLAGPLTNIIFAIGFVITSFFVGKDTILFTIPLFTVCAYGAMINAWLGLFNMIPFGNFDGKKIFDWNKWVFGITAGAAVVLVFFFSVGAV